MDKDYLLSKGWKLTHPEDPKCEHFYRTASEKKGGGYGLRYAIDKQKESEDLKEFGIHYKIIQERLGFGYRLTYALKGQQFFITRFISDSKEPLERMIESYEKTREDVSKINLGYWEDWTKVNRLVVHKTEYGDNYYSISCFSDLLTLCFKMLKGIIKEEREWADEAPKDPNIDLATITNDELRESAQKMIDSYNTRKKAYDDQYKEISCMEKYYETWQAEGITNWQNYFYIVMDFVTSKAKLELEDFSNPDNVEEN